MGGGGIVEVVSFCPIGSSCVEIEWLRWRWRWRWRLSYRECRIALPRQLRPRTSLDADLETPSSRVHHA